MSKINERSKQTRKIIYERDLRKIKQREQIRQRKQMQPKPISQHRTKQRAMDASERHSRPSYVRRDTSPSPYRWNVWRRRR